MVEGSVNWTSSSICLSARSRTYTIERVKLNRKFQREIFSMTRLLSLIRRFSDIFELQRMVFYTLNRSQPCLQYCSMTATFLCFSQKSDSPWKVAPVCLPFPSRQLFWLRRKEWEKTPRWTCNDEKIQRFLSSFSEVFIKRRVNIFLSVGCVLVSLQSMNFTHFDLH